MRRSQAGEREENIGGDISPADAYTTRSPLPTHPAATAAEAALARAAAQREEALRRREFGSGMGDLERGLPRDLSDYAQLAAAAAAAEADDEKEQSAEVEQERLAQSDTAEGGAAADTAPGPRPPVPYVSSSGMARAELPPSTKPTRSPAARQRRRQRAAANRWLQAGGRSVVPRKIRQQSAGRRRASSESDMECDAGR